MKKGVDISTSRHFSMISFKSYLNKEFTRHHDDIFKDISINSSCLKWSLDSVPRNHSLKKEPRMRLLFMVEQVLFLFKPWDYTLYDLEAEGLTSEVGFAFRFVFCLK